MKRKLATLLLALCAFLGVGAIAACGEEENSSSEREGSSQLIVSSSFSGGRDSEDNFIDDSSTESSSSSIENESDSEDSFIDDSSTGSEREEPVVEELDFSLSYDETYYTVTGIGTLTDTDIVIPNSYNNLPVKGIGSSAFKNCISITSITMGDNVTRIGENAFNGCVNLTSVTIGSGVQKLGNAAFYNCVKLSEINFNASVMEDLSSNNDVFYNGGQSEEGITVNIGANVTKIPAYMFYPRKSYAPKIKNVVFAENSICLNIGQYAFAECSTLQHISIPDSVKTIESYAFKGYSLVSVDIGSGLTTINARAFSDSLNLVAVTIPNGVVTVESYAFNGCTSLASVTIGSGVKTIKEYAFKDCTDLTEINYNATDMNDLSDTTYAFYNGGKNEQGITVHIAANVEKIPAYLFFNNSSSIAKIKDVQFEENSLCNSIGEYSFRNCTNLSNIIFPENMLSIGRSSFYGCDNMTSAIMGNKLQNIGGYAFYSCDKLKNVMLPNSVQTVEAYAFQNCISIENVTIGEGVTAMGNEAFSGCTALTQINFNATGMNDFSSGNRVFYQCGQNEEGVTVNIGENVTKIPAYIFGGRALLLSERPKITSVVFEDNGACKSIGAEAFAACTKLMGVYITDIGAWCTTDFKDGNANPLNDAKNLYVNNVIVNTLEIPTGIAEIKAYAFDNCDSLTRVIIPNGVSTIGKFAFNSCDNIVSVRLAESVTTIVQYAFYECVNLTDITIGKEMATIENYAFDYCDKLKKVYYEGVESEWKQITIGTYNNTKLTSATKYWYSETEQTGCWRYVNGVPTLW